MTTEPKTRDRAEMRKVYRRIHRTLYAWRGTVWCTARDVRHLCLNGLSYTPSGAWSRDEETAMAARILALYRQGGFPTATTETATMMDGRRSPDWHPQDTLYQITAVQYVLLRLVREAGGKLS